MGLRFYKFDFRIEGSKQLSAPKTVFIPEYLIESSITKSGVLIFYINTKGINKSKGGVIRYSDVTNLEIITPSGSGAGDVLGTLLAVNTEALNEKTSEVRLTYLNPFTIVKIESRGSKSLITTYSESKTQNASNFNYYLVSENEAQIKDAIENIPAESGGGSGGSQTLAETLVNGNTTDGENINLSDGDAIILDNSSMLKKGTIDAGLGGTNGIAQICAVGYELKWEAGRLYVMGSNGNTIRQSLYNFTTTPTVNDDDTKGYSVGSLWSLDDNTTYICTDATEGAAVWELFNTGGNNMIPSDDELFFNQKFITSADLDIEENYTIVADDLDKLLIFYVDRELYPTFKVKIPEDIPEYVFDFETHIPKIRFYFVDGGVYQTHYQSYFIQPNTQRESGSSTFAEIRTFYVFKDELNDVVLYNASEDGIFGSVDVNETITGYTDQYVNFTNSLQGLGSFTVIEDNDTVEVKNGWNAIGSAGEGIQSPVDNITFNIIKEKHLLGADITIHCLCQVTNVTFNGVVSELTAVPTIIEKGSTLTFRKVQFPSEFGGIDDMVILITEPKDEIIFELGTVTYNDINVAAATSLVQVELKGIPSGYYVDKIYQNVTEVFDTIYGSAGVMSATVSSNLYLGTVGKTVTVASFADTYDITNGFNDLEMFINFDVGGSEVNPQDLTTGSVNIKALIKKFPI
jgi:hypothetical protein